MKASYHKYILDFKRPSGTSRGVLTKKETWFLTIEDNGKKGVGECGILRTLSIDDLPDYEEKLQWTCDHIEWGPDRLWEELRSYPSIQFGVETAFRSLASESPFLLYPSPFTTEKAAIPINGLVWMGSKDFMKEQILQKINEGFRCIKLKIGAIDFQTEIDLIGYIRREFSSKEMEIRVDANGAFSPAEALEKLKVLSDLEIHSIEQPIRQGQWEVMASLCERSPLPVALDEELIGISTITRKKELLQAINPNYLIFKPSLIGGFKGTGEWRDLAEEKDIGWWMTSALESNIGLNAIAQYTYQLKNIMPQGLGTGSLYTNNVESPLYVKEGALWYGNENQWKFNL